MVNEIEVAFFVFTDIFYSIAPEKPVYFQQGPVGLTAPTYLGTPITILGDYPMQCTCPHCGRQIITRIEKDSGVLAWLICAALFIFGLWICCFIPFCVDQCKVSRIWN